MTYFYKVKKAEKLTCTDLLVGDDWMLYRILSEPICQEGCVSFDVQHQDADLLNCPPQPKRVTFYNGERVRVLVQRKRGSSRTRRGRWLLQN